MVRTEHFALVDDMRCIRLCGFVAAELDGGVLDGALCLDDFDGDGEHEVAVGTVTGRLSLFRYAGSVREEDQVCGCGCRCGSVCASGAGWGSLRQGEERWSNVGPCLPLSGRRTDFLAIALPGLVKYEDCGTAHPSPQG